MRGRPGLRCVVFDCRHAPSLARWWARALGWEMHPFDYEDPVWLAKRALTPEAEPSVVGVDPPDPSLPTLWFNEVPERKVVKNRVHVDIDVPDAAGIDRLVALGARVLRRNPDGGIWTIMADPEGNEFCAFPLDADED
jgi:hypothetical protein